MAKFISTRREFEAAAKEVARLEKLVKDGSATDEERSRYHSGCEHLVIWDWVETNAAEEAAFSRGTTYEEMYGKKHGKAEPRRQQTGGSAAADDRMRPVPVGRSKDSGVVSHLRKREEAARSAGVVARP